MSPHPQDRVVVVLVRARNPSNIGAVARGMHDFGFSWLRVVNEYKVPFEATVATEKAAVHASRVLERATQPGSVAEAVADCTLVLGTTAVGDRRIDHPLHTLREAVPIIAEHLAAFAEHAAAATQNTAWAEAGAEAAPEAGAEAGPRVALLFGSEKTGLSRDELSHCHALVTIPMNNQARDGEGQRHLSMNLGQAAAVCLYALSEGLTSPPAQAPDRPDAPPATGAELERLGTLLGTILAQSGYARRHPANMREDVLRRLVWRMGHSSEDATVWSGMLRQIGYALRRDTGPDAEGS